MGTNSCGDTDSIDRLFGEFHYRRICSGETSGKTEGCSHSQGAHGRILYAGRRATPILQTHKTRAPVTSGSSGEGSYRSTPGRSCHAACPRNDPHEIDCPDCGRRFSQYAKACPDCDFPNPLAEHPSARRRALTKRRTRDLQAAPDWDTDEEAGRWEPPAAPPEYRPTQPEYRPPPQQPPQPAKQPETITAYEVVPEHPYDNSPTGFFHGKTHFWFALCIYYLGGLLGLTVATAALGHPIVMLFVVGSWAFVGLFLLLWNAKNLPDAGGTWFARIVIVLILLCWVGAAISR